MVLMIKAVFRDSSVLNGTLLKMATLVERRSYHIRSCPITWNKGGPRDNNYGSSDGLGLGSSFTRNPVKKFASNKSIKLSTSTPKWTIQTFAYVTMFTKC